MGDKIIRLHEKRKIPEEMDFSMDTDLQERLLKKIESEEFHLLTDIELEFVNAAGVSHRQEFAKKEDDKGV